METQKHISRIAAVADIHVCETDRGKHSELFRKVSEDADILLLCGDLTDTGKATEAEILAKELRACTIPVVAVLGNHDYELNQQEEIKKILKKDNFYLLDGESVIIGNVGFAGVKGFGGGFDRYMMPFHGEELNKIFVKEVVDEALKLDSALVRLEGHDDIKKIVLLHYSPIMATVVGEPEQIFPFLGSSHLAGPLNRREVTAAFHGHAHLGTLEGATTTGVKVFNVSQPILNRAGNTSGYYIFEI